MVYLLIQLKMRCYDNCSMDLIKQNAPYPMHDKRLCLILLSLTTFSNAQTGLINDVRIFNGVKNIEHGLLIDDNTAKLVKKNNVVINTQLVIFSSAPDIEGMTQDMKRKNALVSEGLQNLIRLIKKYDILSGFSTDLIFGKYTNIGTEFTARAQYWTPAEILKQATSNAAKIIRMSKLNRHGDFGEIREGWVADLVLLNGEPLEDISILEDKEAAIALVMKNGVIVKTDFNSLLHKVHYKHRRKTIHSAAENKYVRDLRRLIFVNIQVLSVALIVSLLPSQCRW
jgi:hypothetical protein